MTTKKLTLTSIKRMPLPTRVDGAAVLGFVCKVGHDGTTSHVEVAVAQSFEAVHSNELAAYAAEAVRTLHTAGLLPNGEGVGEPVYVGLVTRKGVPSYVLRDAHGRERATGALVLPERRHVL